MTKDEALHLIDRLQMTIARINDKQYHMAVAGLLADISALKTWTKHKQKPTPRFRNNDSTH